MIRFVPDDWFDAVMRPLDMAAPEANTYVEIAAPDLRLAAALLLCFVLLALWRKRGEGSAGPVLWLLALLLVSMAVWLDTSGNGRYFIAWLVLLGPLCAGAMRLLPATRAAKLSVLAGIAGLQIFVLTQNSPFASWTWLNWSDPPYFQVDAPPQEPATYVTIASISYSIVAPQFPPQSRWIGLSAGLAKRDAAFVDQLLTTSPRLTMIAPALPSQTQPDGSPTLAVLESLGRLLHTRGLEITGACTMLESEGVKRIIVRQRSASDRGSERKYGFWLCPLRYRPGPVTAPPEVDPAVATLFTAVEKICPRFFSDGNVPLKINGGWLKNYDSDTKVYVLDDGSAYYKFWRSLNPVKIGAGDELRAGKAQIDCARIRAPNWRRGGP